MASKALLVLCCMALAGTVGGHAGPIAASESDVVPAVIGKIMPLFFERASKVVIQLVRDNLSKAHLGDLETYADVPVLGQFRVDLADITLEGLDLADTSTGLALGDDGAFLLSVQGLRAGVTTRFTYQRTSFPQFGGNGVAHVSATGGNAELHIRCANDGAGRPMITAVDAAQLGFANLGLTISDTDLAWLYNLIAAAAAQPIQDAITREVAAQVTQEVPELANRFLGGIPRTLDVKGLELNISLAGDPLVAADALVVRDWGRFQSPFAETGTQSLIRRGPGAAAGAAAAAVAEGREEAEALGGVRAAPAHGASDAAGSDQAHVDGRIEEEVWGSGSGVGTAGAAAGNWEECPYRRALSDAVLGGALSGGGGEGNRGGNTTADPMIIGLVDQSITNCFTWVLFERGQLRRAFEGDDLPGFTLYTATWGLIVPGLADAYPGNRKMAVQVSVAAPPETSIDAARGVVTSGELTLAFHLAPDAEVPDQAAPAPKGLSPWKPGQAAAAGQQGPATDAAADSVRGDSPLMSSTRAAATHRRALQQQEQQQQQGAHKDWLFEKQLAAIELGWSEWLLQRGEASRGREQGRAGQPGAAALGRPRGEAPMGQHLFTVGIGGEIMATKLALEPDAPARPQSYRLGITMGLDLPSLRIKVLSSDVGNVNEARLQLLFSVVAFLLQAEINGSVLKDGFPLPDIPHVRFTDPDLTFAQYAVRLAANVQYVP